MKIVFLDGHAANPGDFPLDPFCALGEVVFYERTAPDALIERAKDAEILFLNKVVIGRAEFAKLPKLKYIGVLATGYNVVDVAAAREYGVTVTNVPAYSTEAVAQMTFALLLELCSRVGEHSALVAAGAWCESPDFCFWRSPLTELAGKTLGIVGWGKIGGRVAEIARAFGMRVLCCNRSQKPGVNATLDEVLSESDIVSLHCPQTAENAGMISAGAIAKMKDGALLINTARGGLIDEVAVRDALLCGKLGGYAADVICTEPMPKGHVLQNVPNCILTPHIAWAPKETRARLLSIAEENLRAFLSGRAQNVVS